MQSPQDNVSTQTQLPFSGLHHLVCRSPHSAVPDYFLSGEAHTTRHANTDGIKQLIQEFCFKSPWKC